jgi:hypothetical protein
MIVGEIHPNFSVPPNELVHLVCGTETLEIKEQKREVTGDVGAANREAELNAIEDLKRAGRIEQHVLALEIAVTFTNHPGPRALEH